MAKGRNEMACKNIVPFTVEDLAAGIDIVSQVRAACKDECGRVWIKGRFEEPGINGLGTRVGNQRGDKICER